MERMQSFTAAKIDRADADEMHHQKDKEEDFTVNCRDDMYLYMLKLSASLLDKPKPE